ncbi:hypothetical protein [Sphaerisporangium sp. NPDC051011]|uniref:hypothetical protein n=1 Tax=Sphaerisporangium sp. NPDC051011 TaxID=3155792 RepID=UPI0033E09755
MEPASTAPPSPAGRAALEYVTWWRWPLFVEGITGTTDPELVRGCVVAVSGDRFDAVRLRLATGEAVLSRLTERGCWLGPALSDGDRVAFLVRPGEREHWEALAEVVDDGLVLPLTPTTRWVVPPTTANVPRLPGFHELGRVLAWVCSRRS